MIRYILILILGLLMGSQIVIILKERGVQKDITVIQLILTVISQLLVIFARIL